MYHSTLYCVEYAKTQQVQCTIFFFTRSHANDSRGMTVYEYESTSA